MINAWVCNGERVPFDFWVKFHRRRYGLEGVCVFVCVCEREREDLNPLFQI